MSPFCRGRKLRLREGESLAQGDTALSVAEVRGHPLSLLYPNLALVPLGVRPHGHHVEGAGICGQKSQFSDLVWVSVFPSMKWVGWKALPLPYEDVKDKHHV